MSRTLSNGQTLNAVIGRQTPAGEPRGSADEVLTRSVQEAVVRAAFAILNPEDLAEVVASRLVVEQAIGMLMLIYELDADNAFEVLKWGSQTQNVKLRGLAEQFINDLAGLAGSGRVVDLRSACDDVLFAADEQAGAASPPVREP